MRLIAITFPYFFEGEDAAICRLLDRGWERVHIRKPEADAASVATLIERIPGRYYPAITLHDHFELAERYGLGGIHLNRRNPVAPAGWQGVTSRSCHSLEEVVSCRNLDYLTLSPIYDSISKPGYNSRFDIKTLKTVCLDNVYAMGGVTFSRLRELQDVGFAGAAMLSEAWKIRNDMLQFITHTDRGLKETLRGGCRWVQLRMKDVSDDEFAYMARRILPLCRRYDATVIFDDRVELVNALGADGVHLGKNDMPVSEARAILGQGKIIGATANTAADVMAAQDAGADYIGLGPYRFTTTKKRLSPILGIEGYSKIMAECRQRGLKLPVVAIGGIGLDDLTALRLTGVDGVAVSGLILNSEDPEGCAHNIIRSWKDTQDR